MTSGWEKFQELVKAEMRKVYSETVVDHALNPRNVGDMADADSFGRITGPCGDTMEIWLKVRTDTIARATFMTDGCGTTIAAGSMVTELARGKRVSQALRINQEDVLNAMYGLPEESEHCALLADPSPRAAINRSIDTQKEDFSFLGEVLGRRGIEEKLRLIP